MSIRVIVADDHTIIREGIKTAIERKATDIVVVGMAVNGKELLALAEKLPADIFIMDISMPLLNGIEATQRLLKRRSDAKVIILSMHAEYSFVERAIRSGARGYLLKEDAIEQVMHAIRQVFAGQFYLSTKISGFIVHGFLDTLNGMATNIKSERLSSREREILQLIAEGHTTKDVAKILDITVNTANTHKKNIMSKLNLHRQSELIRYAIKELIAT